MVFTCSTRFKYGLGVVDGATAKDNKKKLPLHCAGEGAAPAEVIKLLLKAHPDGAKAKDKHGQTALHIAAWHGQIFLNHALRSWRGRTSVK